MTRKISILLLLMLSIISLTTANLSTDIDQPDEGFQYDIGDNLQVTWTSTNDFDVDRTLNKTEILVEDDIGVRETFEIGSRTVGAQSSNQFDETINGDDLESQEPGDWSVEVVDYWEEYESGEEFYQDETTADLVSGTAEETTDPEGDVFIEFDEPQGNEVYPDDEDLLVRWFSNNDYNVDQELEQSELEINGGDISYSETIQRNEMVSSDQNTNYDFNIPESELSGAEGDKQITITDTWEHETTQNSMTVTFEEEGDEDTEETTDAGGEVYTNIIQPDSYEQGQDLEVEWEAENDYSNSHDLLESEIRVEGDMGRTETEIIPGETFSAGETKTYMTTFDYNEIEDFEPGEWQISVEDDWETDESTDTTTLTVEDENDEQQTEELVASASSDLSLADVGDNFEFDGSGSTGEIDGFEWSFDDGNIATGEIVTHSFEAEGTYNVELEVTGQTDIDTDTVTVEVEEGAEQQESEDTDEDSDETDQEQDETEEETETTDGDTDEDTTDDGTDDSDSGDDRERGDPAADEDGELEEDDESGESDDGEQCPDGFEWDEENEVCVQTDEETGSVGALDTVTSPEVAGIPVWLITLLTVFVGLQVYWW